MFGISPHISNFLADSFDLVLIMMVFFPRGSVGEVWFFKRSGIRGPFYVSESEIWFLQSLRLVLGYCEHQTSNKI